MQIKKMEETIHGLDLKVKERDLKNKNLQDKVSHIQRENSGYLKERALKVYMSNYSSNGGTFCR